MIRRGGLFLFLGWLVCFLQIQGFWIQKTSNVLSSDFKLSGLDDLEESDGWLRQRSRRKSYVRENQENSFGNVNQLLHSVTELAIKKCLTLVYIILFFASCFFIALLSTSSPVSGGPCLLSGNTISLPCWSPSHKAVSFSRWLFTDFQISVFFCTVRYCSSSESLIKCPVWNSLSPLPSAPFRGPDSHCCRGTHSSCVERKDFSILFSIAAPKMGKTCVEQARKF